MDEDLRVAFSKKEKVERFLANLDKLKAEESIEEAPYQDLRAEYAAILEEATSSIKSIKAKLRREFDKKAGEMETAQKEHDLLEARLSVGEVRSEAYWTQIKPLKKKIAQLKKEVPELRVMVGATSSAELGGPTKVDIPELKIKKTLLKPAGRARSKKQPEVAATEKEVSSDPSSARRKAVPSKDPALVNELLKDTPNTALPGERRGVSASEKTREAKKEKESRLEKRGGTGTRAAFVVVAAVVLVIIIFVVGRALPSILPDIAAPTISEVTFSKVAGSSVTIEWTTNEKATSQVILRDPGGISTSTEPDKALVTRHSIKVSGVKPDIKYRVTLKSLDASGNEGAQVTEQTFVAIAPINSALPVISDASVSDVTDIGAVITWKTDKPATSQVMVNETTSKVPYLTETKVTFVTSHSVTLLNLKPAVTYAFTLVSKDASGNQTTYEFDKTFTTLASFPVGPEIGKRAPDFILPTTDGKNLTLSSFRGKIVMVNFWLRSCPACVREMPLMQSFFEKLAGDGVVILAINAGESAGDVQSFAQRWRITFPVLLDSQRKVTDDYKISPIPATFFIDSQGIIKGIKNEPFSDLDDIGNSINSALKPVVSK